MTFVCDVCDSILASDRNLKIHKETAKKCIRLQIKNGIDIDSEIALKLKEYDANRSRDTDRIECELCSSNILKSSYKSHLASFCRKFDEKKHTYSKVLLHINHRKIY